MSMVRVPYDAIHFNSFEVAHIPQEGNTYIIIIHIYRIQAYDSIICGYFCVGFIDFMLKGKKFARLYKFILS